LRALRAERLRMERQSIEAVRSTASAADKFRSFLSAIFDLECGVQHAEPACFGDFIIQKPIRALR
jgi:hypothetical protein